MPGPDIPKVGSLRQNGRTFPLWKTASPPTLKFRSADFDSKKEAARKGALRNIPIQDSTVGIQLPRHQPQTVPQKTCEGKSLKSKEMALDLEADLQRFRDGPTSFAGFFCFAQVLSWNPPNTVSYKVVQIESNRCLF